MVKQLILQRSKLDGSRVALTEPQVILGATEMATLYEPVFLTYLDLDRLIAECGLSLSQHRVVQSLMEGYSLTDSAEMHSIPKQAAHTHLLRAVDKITAYNDQVWFQVHGKKNSL